MYVHLYVIKKRLYYLGRVAIVQKKYCKYKGFTLIELTLYLGAAMLFLPVLFSFLHRMHSNFQQTVRQQECYIKNIVVQQLLYQDIASASSQAQEWDLTSLRFKIYRLNSRNKLTRGWVEWRIEGEYIRRIFGEWDPVRDLWVNKTSKIFPCNSITSIERRFLYHAPAKVVKSVSLVFCYENNKKESLSIRLRNGEL